MLGTRASNPALAHLTGQRPQETIDPHEFYADYTKAIIGVDAADVFERIERARQTTPEFGTWFLSDSPAAADRARKWASLRAALACGATSLAAAGRSTPRSRAVRSALADAAGVLLEWRPAAGAVVAVTLDGVAGPPANVTV